MTALAGRPLPPARRVHAHTFRVLYGDTDQMGVAYYANYLRWFEAARNEYLRAAGFPYRKAEAAGIRLPVVEALCRYASPAHYDDLLRIESWVEERGRVRIRFAYRILREGGSDVLATGSTVHACVDPETGPCRIPESLLLALEAFENGVHS